MREVSNKRMIGLLFRKEIKDIFRDRKSVLMMFFVPVIMYPLIFLVAFFVMSLVQTGVSVQTYHIVLDGMPDGRVESELKSIQIEDNKENTTYEMSFFDKEEFGLIVSEQADDSQETVMNPDEDKPESNGKALGDLENMSSQQDDNSTSIAKALEDESIDAYLSYDSGEYVMYYNSSVTNSANTASIIRQAVAAVKQDLIEERIDAEGLDAQEILNPIEYEDEDMATSEQSLGYFLGTIIPFMMVMSLFSGVFSPAMDATTGEKERGTLETLLMMPVTETQVIVSKFLSVALIGLLTTLLSVISMAAMGVYLLDLISSSGAIDMGAIDVSTFIPTILLTFPVLAVLSLFLTAVSLCVTCFAKSNKEASTYMSPIMLVVMFTGYIGFIPNIEFDRTMAMIPVANVCLLIKNLLLFKVNYELVLIVIASTAVYTGLVILLLGKLYKSEAVLFDEGRHGLALIESRANMKPGGVPTSGDGWFIVMVGFLLLVYIGGLLQTKFGLDGVAMTQGMILLLPLLMAVYTKKNIRDTFSLNRPKQYAKVVQATSYGDRLHGTIVADGSVRTDNGYGTELNLQSLSDNSVRSGVAVVRGMVGGIILGLGAILFGMVVAEIMAGLFPQEGEAFSDTLMGMFDAPPIYVWIVVAVLPAICEEMLFRGYILSAFRSRYGKWTAIIAVGIFFGIYHTSLMRFPSTALLGVAFAYITYMTGSIFPGMILHCINNSIAVLSMYFPEWIEEHIPFLSDGLPLSTMMIVSAVAIVLIEVGRVLILNKSKV